MKRFIGILMCSICLLCGCSVTINMGEDKADSTIEPVPIVVVTPTPSELPTPTPIVETQTPIPTNTPNAESMKHPIEILNGAAIDGLATKYQQMLEKQGFHVVNIGNYTGMKQEKTTIYTKSPKWAKKLKHYIPFGAEIIKLPATDNDIDTRIILGVNADNFFYIKEADK